MKKIRETTKIIEPENQLKLYGYKNHFDSINHLCQPKNKVSTHILINKKGEIYYLVKVSIYQIEFSLSDDTNISIAILNPYKMMILLFY